MRNEVEVGIIVDGPWGADTKRYIKSENAALAIEWFIDNYELIDYKITIPDETNAEKLNF